MARNEVAFRHADERLREGQALADAGKLFSFTTPERYPAGPCSVTRKPSGPTG